jgi:hypothetical protein
MNQPELNELNASMPYMQPQNLPQHAASKYYVCDCPKMSENCAVASVGVFDPMRSSRSGVRCAVARQKSKTKSRRQRLRMRRMNEPSTEPPKHNRIESYMFSFCVDTA